MRVPLVDLKAQYLSMKAEIDAAIADVIDRTAFILGPDLRAFEAEFAAFCDARYAVGVSSGTDALHLALLACDIRPGDEVITTPHTFIATAEVISFCGATPVFADIDPATYNLDPNQVEAKLTPRTRALLPVHLYGQPADMDALIDIARRHDLRVVEDAAQAHGARYRGRAVGDIGDIGCFSFYPGKNLGAYGDAGMVVTDDEDMANRIRLLRNHGRESKYEHQFVGYGDRLDNLQAAILRAKLRHLPDWNEARRAHARAYTALLADTGVATPFEPDWAHSVYHLYVIRAPERDALIERLRGDDIEAGVHYPLPLHLQPAYVHLGHRGGDFPHTEKAAAEVVSLPMYPELTSEQIERVVAGVKAHLATAVGR